jgi:threonine dehydrogenase-like Zn-dependent dehydrogenase
VSQSLPAVVHGATAGSNGVDVAIDTSGHDRAIRDALSSIVPGGALVLTGLPDREIGLDLTHRFALADYEAAFDVSASGAGGKVIFTTE